MRIISPVTSVPTKLPWHTLLQRPYAAAESGRQASTAAANCLALLSVIGPTIPQMPKLVKPSSGIMQSSEAIFGLVSRCIRTLDALRWFGLVWFYSYAEAGVAHADLLSSYRKRKTLWGIKTSPSAFLMSTCFLFSSLFPAVPRS